MATPTPLPQPSIQQFEVYTQTGPLVLGPGLYVSVDGEITVDVGEVDGVINCGTF